MAIFSLQRKTTLKIVKDKVQKHPAKSDTQISTEEAISIWKQFITSLHPSPTRHLLAPTKIHQTPPSKNFNIDIQLTTATHGYLTPSRSQRASLLIFSVQLVSLHHKTPFKRFSLQATMVEDEKSEVSSRPEILAHAPFADEEALKEKHVHVKEKTEVDDGAEVGLSYGGVQIGSIGRHWIRSRKASFVETYHGRGASATIVDGDGKKSGIWWNVKQSSIPYTKDDDDAGIDPNYKFAVLVSRSGKEVFKVRFKLEVHAGMGFWVENKMSNYRTVKDLEVNPRVWKTGECGGIERESLGVFREQERLVELTKCGR